MRVAVRTRRQVDDRARQGLVEGREARAEALDAANLAERLFERLAQRNRTVLGRVVVINVQVAAALQLQGQAAVLGQRLQHVVEEAEARRHLDLLRRVDRMRVQRDRHLDLRLVRSPLQRRHALGHGGGGGGGSAQWHHVPLNHLAPWPDDVPRLRPSVRSWPSSGELAKSARKRRGSARRRRRRQSMSSWRPCSRARVPRHRHRRRRPPQRRDGVNHLEGLAFDKARSLDLSLEIFRGDVVAGGSEARIMHSAGSAVCRSHVRPGTRRLRGGRALRMASSRRCRHAASSWRARRNAAGTARR